MERRQSREFHIQIVVMALLPKVQALKPFQFVEQGGQCNAKEKRTAGMLDATIIVFCYGNLWPLLFKILISLSFCHGIIWDRCATFAIWQREGVIVQV